jgi:hypothetical protein
MSWPERTEKAAAMSTGAAEEWDVIVPADGDELLAELRRHGVRPGQRLHLTVFRDGQPGSDDGLPGYIGSFATGQPDFAERAAEILRAEFPGR